MQKIELPIEKGHEDHISPFRPDWKWLATMLAIIIVVVASAWLFGKFFSHFVVARMDIETERTYFGSLMLDDTTVALDPGQYGLSLTGRLASYPIFVTKSSVENAYATLGANIILTSELLQNIKNTEELLFIIAHEAAHIENRDVLAGAAQMMPVTLTLQFLGIDLGISGLDTANLTKNYFTRTMEERADAHAIETLSALGYNLACATRFFEEHESHFEKYNILFSDHPENRKRIDAMLAKNKNPEKRCTEIVREKIKDI